MEGERREEGKEEEGGRETKGSFISRILHLAALIARYRSLLFRDATENLINCTSFWQCCSLVGYIIFSHIQQ